MKNRITVFRTFTWRAQVLLVGTCVLTALTSSFATVLDDFNAAQRSGWQAADPGNFGLPGGQQTNGVFTFQLPALGQDFFVSSTKTSRTFELKEGRTTEFRVDMVSGLGVDSYAVMGFIPASPGPNSLAGYGLAKSESDVLITKGINKYFIDDNPTIPVKNTNVTLVLNLRVKGGNVYITGRVLDKDANNAVIWERSFVDTPGADVLGTGADDPPAPYITTGNFVLYLYAQNGKDPSGYQVVYDNAEYFEMDTTVLDDFNAPQRSGWVDSTPAPFPLPGGTQTNGVFTFGLPALGQPIFTESIKNTRTFTLDEGTRHVFSVDFVSGQGPDSYGVLAFVPTTPGPDSLAGYGLAKSESDILVSKGINKYFIDDVPSPSVKNTNVTLVLNLTAQHGNVIIRGQVLDKDNNNQILWDKTFVDSPAADILGTGQDNPPAPYLGVSGNIVLYLYANNGTDPNGYQVVYDNLIVSEPPGATNQPPIIANVSPKDGTAFLSAPVALSFNASDDKDLPDTGISVQIGNTIFSSTNGLNLSGAATNRSVTLATGTGANSNYVATIIVTDSDGASVTNSIYFDTFTSADRVIEIEDYNFNPGQWYNNPIATTEGSPSDNSYCQQQGTEGIDFHDTRTAPSGNDTLYRSLDPVRMQHSLDQQRSKYDTSLGIYGYDVGDIAADEWLNYTKDFVEGSYEIYLREAVVGFPQADSTLELVTSDSTVPNQTVSSLGSFLGKLSGYTYRNVPLTDGSGLNKVQVRLTGTNTLRLHQITADTTSSARYQNYLILVPVVGAAIQRPIITSIQPSPDSTVQTVSPTVSVVIQNRDTRVNTNTLVLQVNGATVSPIIQVTNANTSVTWAMTPLPASGALNTASISFADNQGTNQTTSWKFTVTYPTLDAANARTTPGPDRGMNVRMVQAPQGSGLDNSLDRAEQQLAIPSSIPAAMQTNQVLQIISMTSSGTAFGGFQDFTDIPGVDGSIGTDDFTVEAQTWLALSAGVYDFGVYTDDGYKLSAGATPASKDPVLFFHNGGPANETNSLVVTVSGVYPFRFLWYQRGGSAYGQWFSVNRTTGEAILINDPNSAGAIKAYLTATTATPPSFTSSSVTNGQLTIAWTGSGVLQESPDLKDQKSWTDVPNQPKSPYTLPVGTAAGGKFYRIKQ